MPRFMVYYSTDEWGKAWFDAESLEQAEELLAEVMDGQRHHEDLPAYNFSVKGGEAWQWEGLTQMEADA